MINAEKNISTLNDTQKYAYASLIYNMIEPGDVVQYGFSTNDIRHSQVSYARGKSNSGHDTLLMAQHTDNRLDIKLHDYIYSTGYTYIVYYNMGKLK